MLNSTPSAPPSGTSTSTDTEWGRLSTRGAALAGTIWVPG